MTKPLDQMSTDELKALLIQMKKEVVVDNAVQHSAKILMNSLYGATSNKYFAPYFSLAVAESITSTGQAAIRFIGIKIDEYLNKLLGTKGVEYVAYQDTDSVYVVLEKLVIALKLEGKPEDEIVDALDNICKNKIEPYIDQCYKEFAKMLNAHSHQMFMKREAISTAGIWCGKKRYSLHVRDNEGVRYPGKKLKYVGLEATRSNIPAKCRAWLEDCYNFALLGDKQGLHSFVQKCRDEYFGQSPEEVASVSTANNIAKFQQDGFIAAKGTPKHIKAVINHNKLAASDKTRTLKPITESEKFLLVELDPKKNAYGFEVFGFSEYFPVGFGLEKAIDYGTMFEKNFLDPLRNFLDAIGWQPEETASLDDFFA